MSLTDKNNFFSFAAPSVCELSGLCLLDQSISGECVLPCCAERICSMNKVDWMIQDVISVKLFVKLIETVTLLRSQSQLRCLTSLQRCDVLLLHECRMYPHMTLELLEKALTTKNSLRRILSQKHAQQPLP